MKRIFYLMVMVTIISGCEDASYVKKPTIYSDGRMKDLKVYVIDGCEYIGKLRGGNSDVLTHKGNCKFCEERNGKK